MPLDSVIFITFIFYLLASTYMNYSEVKSINSYSIGRRSFTTFALGATITATFVSGSAFILDLDHFHIEGWAYLLPALCMIVCFIIVGLVIAPRAEKFLGKTSVATIMYEEYGLIARWITAAAGIIAVCGGISIQFKILGKICNYFLPEIPWEVFSIILGCITIAYTVIGGIKSVVYTDIIQTICFIIAVSIAISLLYSSNTNSTANQQHFNIMSVASLPKDQFRDMILLGLYFLIPGMAPATVQRISMGISVRQVRRSYLWSSLFIFLITMITCYISYLLFYHTDYHDKVEMLPFLFDQFTIPGSKAIIVIGIISMCMSTADSNINIASVLLANDTYKCTSLNDADKLLRARYMGILIGIISLAIIFIKLDLLKTILLFRSFYIPLVTAPMLLLVFDWKTTPRCCILSMLLSLSYVIINRFIIKSNFDVNFYGLMISFCLLLSSHYIIEKWEWLKPLGITSQLKKKGKL